MDPNLISDGQEVTFTRGASVPDGVYDFTVLKVQDSICSKHSRYANIPKKRLTLELREHGQTDPNVFCFETDIVCARSLSWRISQFFASIGMTDFLCDGDTFIPEWKEAVGRKGKCRVRNTDRFRSPSIRYLENMDLVD